MNKPQLCLNYYRMTVFIDLQWNKRVRMSQLIHIIPRDLRDNE